MKTRRLRPEYVQFIPPTLVQGVLYISKEFETASHLCCCGCGTKIVTPLHASEYSLTERDGRISLRPSIGNWDHPCQSHYWIRDNAVIQAAPMSRAEIELGRAYDDASRDAYFSRKASPWWRRALRRVKSWWNGLLK